MHLKCTQMLSFQVKYTKTAHSNSNLALSLEFLKKPGTFRAFQIESFRAFANLSLLLLSY